MAPWIWIKSHLLCSPRINILTYPSWESCLRAGSGSRQRGGSGGLRVYVCSIWASGFSVCSVSKARTWAWLALEKHKKKQSIDIPGKWAWRCENIKKQTNKQKLHPTPFWRNVKCKSGGWREPAYWGLGRLADLKFPSVSTKSLPADFWAGEWSGLIGNLEVPLWEKKYGTKVWNDQRLTLISSNDRRDGRNKQKHNRGWQLCVSWREGWDGA